MDPSSWNSLYIPYSSLSWRNWLGRDLGWGAFNFFNFNFYFILLYSTVLVLPYINMSPPRVYMSSQSWTPLPPPSPYHLSGSSQCTSPKHPVSCIKHGLAIHFTYDSIHVSMPFSQIIPPLPSSAETNRVFYTFVSLLLSCIELALPSS